MTDFLRRLIQPVILDGPEHAHHGTAHGAGGAHVEVARGLAGLWPVLAVVVLIAGSAWLAVMLLRRVGWPLAGRQRLAQPGRLQRGIAVALLAASLLTLPLLSLHATHHLDGDAHGTCALAGIAHSASGAVLSSAPVLVPPHRGDVPLPPYLRPDTERMPPRPIARGPPAGSSLG